MRVVITGGGGFLGQALARSVLRRGQLLCHAAGSSLVERIERVSEIVLADVSRPASFLFPELEKSEGVDVQVAVGDVSDLGFCNALLGSSAATPVSVFHLGAVMSATGEQDFDLCMRVNLMGTLNMLQAARHSAHAREHGGRPRFIMTSAGATLGAGAPTDFVSKDDVVGDSTRATPHTTYGMTKACAELLLSDYSRRGFIDGRACRLPTVAVRPGAPNAATTGDFSSVVREPLAGQRATPRLDAHMPHAVTSYRTAVDALLTLHDASAAEADAVLGFDRTVFVPSAPLTLAELTDSVKRAVDPAAHGALGEVSYAAADRNLTAAVGSFPTKVDCSRAMVRHVPQPRAPALSPRAAAEHAAWAQALGIGAQVSADGIVADYVADFPSALGPGVRLRAGAAGGARSASVSMATRPARSPPRDAADGAGAADVSVVLVTGGGTGIGRAVALRLAAGGWQQPGAGSRVAVVLTGRRAEPLDETAALVRDECGGAEALCVPADLTVEADVDRLFGEIKSRYGRLDVLFNNAGVNVPPTTVDAMGMDEWRWVVGTNLDAAFHVAREAFRLMKAQAPRGGRIINNGSVSAESPRPGSVAYTASKHAISGLTKSIALDGRGNDIACGQVDYGNVVSAISAGMAVGMPQPDGSVRPEPRMEPADAANAVHYMCSLPLTANVLTMTVMATEMPFVGRG